jgi:hypothetical protein
MTPEDVEPWHTALAEAVEARRQIFNKQTDDPVTRIVYFNALCVPLGLMLVNGSDPAFYLITRFDLEKQSVIVETFQRSTWLKTESKRKRVELPIISATGSPLLLQDKSRTVGADDLARALINAFYIDAKETTFDHGL